MSLIKKLLAGDLVLGDRGFTVHEQVWFHQAELNIPAVTRGKNWLDPVDVEKTRKYANVRIHMERVVGIQRQNVQSYKVPCQQTTSCATPRTKAKFH